MSKLNFGPKTRIFLDFMSISRIFMAGMNSSILVFLDWLFFRNMSIDTMIFFVVFIPVLVMIILFLITAWIVDAHIAEQFPENYYE